MLQECSFTHLTRSDLQDALVTYRGRTRIVSVATSSAIDHDHTRRGAGRPRTGGRETRRLQERNGWDEAPAVHILDGPAYFNRPGPA